MSGKLAQIIGNREYEDASLAGLVTPDADVNALTEILRHSEMALIAPRKRLFTSG